MSQKSKLKRLTDIVSEGITWLWPERIPLGKVTGLGGEPGCGKSFLSLKLCADLSAGRPLPFADPLPPQNVLYLTTEDEFEDTLKPRLDTMGANFKNFFGYDEPIYLDADGYRDLEDMIKDCNPKLVVLDTITGYTSGKVDTRKSNEVRQMLHPLKEMAKQYNFAALFLCHLNKQEGGKGINRISGSMDYVGLARSFLLAGANVKDEKDKVLFQIKSNLGPISPPLSYCMVNGNFAWNGESSLKLEDVLSPKRTTSRKKDAEEFLIFTLMSGPKAATDVTSMAKKIGITEATLRRARENLGVICTQSHPDGKKGGDRWAWQLNMSGQDNPVPATSGNSTGERS